MVTLRDVEVMAWAVRKLRAALRADDKLTGPRREAARRLVDSLDTTRELAALAVRQRAARRARTKAARGAD